MISQDLQGLLEILRCPLDPKRQTALKLEGDKIICPACGLRYPIKDGFPIMIVEEAELPPGCESLEAAETQHTSPG